MKEVFSVDEQQTLMLELYIVLLKISWKSGGLCLLSPSTKAKRALEWSLAPSSTSY